MPATDPERITETIYVDVTLSASVPVEVEPGRNNDDYIQHQIAVKVLDDKNRLFYLENLEVENYE